MSTFHQIEKHLAQLEERLSKSQKPLSVHEACLYLGVSKSQIYKLTHFKKIPFSKPNGKKIYFKECDLVDWAAKNRIKTNDEIEMEIVNREFGGLK